MLNFRDLSVPDGVRRGLNYHSGLWLLLNRIILSQTCPIPRNDSIKDSEVENRWNKKKDFADLVKDAKSVATVSGFTPWTEWRHINMAWLPRQFQNGDLRSRSFNSDFLRIAVTSEPETSMSGKA